MKRAGAAAFEVAAETCTAAGVPAAGVPASGACEIELLFRPNAEGQIRAALAIETSAGPEPHRISLLGAGILPHAAITPARLSFGEVAVKTVSGRRAVRVASSTMA